MRYYLLLFNRHIISVSNSNSVHNKAPNSVSCLLYILHVPGSILHWSYDVIERLGHINTHIHANKRVRKQVPVCIYQQNKSLKYLFPVDISMPYLFSRMSVHKLLYRKVMWDQVVTLFIAASASSLLMDKL